MTPEDINVSVIRDANLSEFNMPDLNNNVIDFNLSNARRNYG